MNTRKHFYHPTRWERCAGHKPEPERQELGEAIRAIDAAFPAWLMRTTGRTWVEGEIHLRQTMHQP